MSGTQGTPTQNTVKHRVDLRSTLVLLEWKALLLRRMVG
jgi:hypothetical protein